ncbi:hypothetical protein MRAB57_1986 [Mycobacterium rhizamassiliense]|jgi:hypothetical protein|uniref:Uncharacterized protein n=1 Tax=Mycobacterium rhizamassiliense TaxID=1841860 RepID=A0A2U3NRV0_9MYCO|nr:hypothetical protein [Mycobacterium rhizamassiliense]SPM34173.1 hypothetical protein MRAB57_1986 [Mycobacterium rhizamassiliense]
MGVSVLAAGGPGYVAGQLAFDFGIPLIGLVCLIIGLRESARSRRQQRPAYPAYPYPPGPPPMGYPGAGYPGPYPPRPYPGYPPYPPPPPPRPKGKSGTALIIIGAVLLTFGILGNVVRVAGDMAGKSHRGASDTSIQVGECITQKAYLARSFGSGPANNCSDPANIDELVYKSDTRQTCPDGKREHSLYDWFADGSTILCFAMNLKQGDCYLATGDMQNPSLSYGDCTDDRQVLIKVVQRIDGSADKMQCPTDTKGISYPDPARVYCLARAGT